MKRVIDGLDRDDAKDAIRAVAGLLIAVGFLLVAVRRGSPEVFGDGTSHFGLFVIFGVAAAFLYGTGMAGRVLGRVPRRWQGLYTVAGVILLPAALFELAAAIDTSYDGSLVTLLVFAVCAAAAAAAWLLAAVRFQLLIAALYAGIAWIAFVDKAFDGPDLDTTRALLLLFAAAIAAVAVLVGRRATVQPDPAAGDLLTAAGLIALIALALAPVGALIIGQAVSVFGLQGTQTALASDQSLIWDLLTIVLGVVLVVFGLGRGLRGPVYVGALLLALFVFSAGLDLDDTSPEGKLVGWPLILCLLGAVLFLVSLAPRERLGPAGSLDRWFDGEAGHDDDRHAPAADAPTQVVAVPPPADEPPAPDPPPQGPASGPPPV